MSLYLNWRYLKTIKFTIFLYCTPLNITFSVPYTLLQVISPNFTMISESFTYFRILMIFTTGLFNPSGRNQQGPRPLIDGPIPKSFQVVVATFCWFDILYLMYGECAFTPPNHAIKFGHIFRLIEIFTTSLILCSSFALF